MKLFVINELMVLPLRDLALSLTLCAACLKVGKKRRDSTDKDNRKSDNIN
jgi:hypothetical protein